MTGVLAPKGWSFMLQNNQYEVSNRCNSAEVFRCNII